MLLGGVRSGKSAWAQRLASRSGQTVRVIATATAEDEEMEARIARHRADRPDDWTVIEEPTKLAEAVRDAAGSGDCLLVDCLSLWLSNLLGSDGGKETRELDSSFDDFCEALEAYSGPVIIVSNEVGLGGIETNDLARRYADELGRLNQRVASRCRQVYLAVAGRLLAVKGDPPSGDSLHAGED
ncbi:bifunctional adenosylcobinamide kinase/adenosylcobinamide-phosphate guanylyltransferase [Methylonatrum kenyense]|uniref:bifunctional adenosylcobinamide kinase/adenosylcobinamide-phosphate guanylyltransferase n=1 Tax=Methylonatrum kenyense TaxID=455253 RepID=UPI0020C0BC6F|nr:bifunctional adenosylcobinamide kinase/adenosylcobinamide-phosphate guanylyltransferase [Methylonatrum kenyense]MCK8515372.1 bifunctional adenosylcobinamide kinase/adenosylcobinamide-phosphate guanylyltransferase [Methylonatrum kenyense]